MTRIRAPAAPFVYAPCDESRLLFAEAAKSDQLRCSGNVGPIPTRPKSCQAQDAPDKLQ